MCFYDWRKYDNYTTDTEIMIGTQFVCQFLDPEARSRIDLDVSSEKVDIHKFEEMSKVFYNSLKSYL